MFQFALPWIFFILPLPLVVRAWLPQLKTQQSQAVSLPFYNKLVPTLPAHSAQSSQLKIGLLWLLWFFLILAISGPEWVGEKQIIKREGRDIMLALDVSGSMQIDDMKLKGRRVDRLTVVKQSALTFVQKRQGDKVGLILFGTKAYLQTPLTFDLKTVEHMIKDATVGLAGQTTSIGDAIGMAVKQLKRTKSKTRVLILLTDGSNNSGILSPVQAAHIAKDNHVKIYTIGLGSTRMLVQNIFGLQAINPSNDLDEKALKDIANITGGTFFRAKNTKDLDNVYKTISTLEPVADEGTVFRPIKNFYYYPLTIVFLLYALLFWYRPISIIPRPKRASS